MADHHEHLEKEAVRGNVRQRSAEAVGEEFFGVGGAHRLWCRGGGLATRGDRLSRLLLFADVVDEGDFVLEAAPPVSVK